MFLLSHVAQPFLQTHFFLIDEVLMFDDSMVNLHWVCQIPMNCLYHWLLAFVTVQQTFVSFFQFPEKFCFCTDKIEYVAWQDLEPQQRICDCFLIHLPRWGLCDRLLQITELFCSKCGFAVASFARDLAILVLKHTLQLRSLGKRAKILCFLEFGRTFLRGWEMCAAAGISVSSGLSVNSSNHSGRSRKRSSASRLSSFFFVLVLRFFLSVETCLSLRPVFELEEDKSGTDDVEDEAVPELVVNPAMTKGTKCSVLKAILFPCLFSCGRWPLAHTLEYPCSSQSFPSDRTAGVSSRNCTVTKRPRSWTKTSASSFVCTVVLDLCKVSSSSELKSFSLSMCIDAPVSTTNSLSSNNFEVSARIALASTGEKNVVLSAFFELVEISRQVPCCFADASLLIQGFLLWPLLELGSARTTLMRLTIMDMTSRGTLSFPNFLLVPSALG